MVDRQGESDAKDSPQRKQTDASLRVERQLADTRLQTRSTSMEDEADDVVRLARERADELVQSAREDADRETTAEGERSLEQERADADAVLAVERAEADAIVEHERSERKRYLADFLTAEREVTDKDLIGERAHADTLVAGRDEFLAAVSHDLRSLLGGLSLGAALLADGAPQGAAGDAMRKHGATSQRLVARMNRLVNDLLDVASIEAGQLAIYPERVAVAELVRETLAAFEPIAAGQGITLRGEDPPPAGHAWLDAGRILQVLANLVSNALKFTRRGGRIALGVAIEGDEVRFSVSDSGIGIPEAMRLSVFERFRQVSHDRRGLGLGLHICRRIVDAHRGTIWVESQLGIGSTFHFKMPRTAPSLA